MRRTRGSTAKTKSAAESEEDAPTITVWQWKGDQGQWETYSSEACALLDSAVSSGETSLSLDLGSGTAYEMDLKKMFQINPVTKYKRKIRTHAVKQESLNEAGDASKDEKSAPIKEEEEEEEEAEKQPPAKKRKGQSKKQTKAEKKPKEESTSEEVVKTVVMKGKAPVDSECKAKLGKAHIYSEGNDVFDVMLNQTNLQFNNNKYYLIQLLQDDNAKSYNVWMRWGRVGKVGQTSLSACGGDLLKAKDIFKKKFLDKTKNEWDQRDLFEKIPGKYDMVFVDYSANEEEEKKSSGDAAPTEKISKLNVKLRSLMELICDIKAMEECVLEMKFDIQKAPLGKLTTEQIKAGYEALKLIEDCLKKKKSGNKALVEACNLFYTRIPHNFGLKTPPLINTEAQLKEKMALLEALSDIQIAVKMVQSGQDSDEHPVDRHYESLQCKLQLVDPSCSTYTTIEKYLQSTHASTHNCYTMTLVDCFSVDREGEGDNFLSQLHNRTLLWHGSRLSNWVSILSKGLKVAPPEAPVTGYMFGKGIYFADMSSKSANYCFTSETNQTGLLLLCDVALGDANELLHANYDADVLPAGKHSTKGLGLTGPDAKNSVTLDGATVPLGPSVKTGVGKNTGYSLLYNEFIVYNPAQVRMKYLLRVKFSYQYY